MIQSEGLLENIGSSMGMTAETAADPTTSTTATFGRLIREGKYMELIDQFAVWGIEFLGKILLALVIFFVGRLFIKTIRNIIIRLFPSGRIDDTLRTFLRSLLDVLLYVLLFLLIINTVGTKAVSFAALMGAVGLAMGLAVKDNLANFAGGVMLLFNKPFRSGDYIDAQGESGTVDSIGILYTKIITVDNHVIFMPNGPLSTGSITNYSTTSTRRQEIVVGVEYGADVELVKKILMEEVMKHPKILKDPEPFVRLTNMNESSIDFSIRVWTLNRDRWDTEWDLKEAIYTRLNKEGLDIPYPQMTVHLDRGDVEA